MENKDDNLDLDSLKSLWNREMEQQSSAMGFSQQKIIEVMQQKSSTSIQRIKRNLWIEILVTIPFFPFLYIFLEKRGQHIPIWAWSLLVLITFGYHVYLLLKLRKKERSAESNLLNGIQENLQELRGFVRMYDVFAWIFGTFIFIVMSTSSVLLFNKSAPSDGNPIFYGLLILLNLFGGIGAFVSVKWYVNKLYGQHYNALQACQQTLESSEAS